MKTTLVLNHVNTGELGRITCEGDGPAKLNAGATEHLEGFLATDWDGKVKTPEDGMDYLNAVESSWRGSYVFTTRDV